MWAGSPRAKDFTPGHGSVTSREQQCRGCISTLGGENGASSASPAELRRVSCQAPGETCMSDMFQHSEKLGSSLHCQCRAVLCLLNTAQYAPRH